MHRMILIDPQGRSIKPILCAEGDMDQTIGVDVFDTFVLAQHPAQKDYVAVDDEGLARQEPVYAFRFNNNPDFPRAGRGLVFGVGPGGATCGAQTSIGFLREHIEWLGLIVPSVQWVEDERGAVATVTWRAV